MGKNTNSPASKKHATKLAFYAIGALVLLIVLGKLLAFVYSLSQPIASDFQINRNYKLDNKSSQNFLFVNNSDNPKEQISVISLYPREQKIIVMHISNQIYLNVPKEYGMWRVGSIYSLGQEETPKKGALLLTLSVSKLLGLPIDGVIFTKDNKSQKPEEFITKLHKNPLATYLETRNIRSNLTTFEAVKIFNSFSKIRPDKVNSLDLAKSTITESKLLPDTSRVLGIDSFKLDSFIRDKMADTSMVDEGFSVGVFNATEHTGLAQEASRIVTNMGGNVVITASSDIKQEKTSVVLSQSSLDAQKSLTRERLAEVFAPNCIKEICLSKDPKISSSRAPINIILGEDFYNYWHKR